MLRTLRFRFGNAIRTIVSKYPYCCAATMFAPPTKQSTSLDRRSFDDSAAGARAMHASNSRNAMAPGLATKRSSFINARFLTSRDALATRERRLKTAYLDLDFSDTTTFVVTVSHS